MSKFTTTLPVDVNPLMQALPKGAYLHKLSWNPETKCIEALWEDDKLETGLSVPVPFPLKDLSKRVLPRGTKSKK